MPHEIVAVTVVGAIGSELYSHAPWDDLDPASRVEGLTGSTKLPRIVFLDVWTSIATSPARGMNTGSPPPPGYEDVRKHDHNVVEYLIIATLYLDGRACACEQVFAYNVPTSNDRHAGVPSAGELVIETYAPHCARTAGAPSSDVIALLRTVTPLSATPLALSADERIGEH